MTDPAWVLRRRQVPGRTGSMGITIIRAASGGLPGVLALGGGPWPIPRRSAGSLERRPGSGTAAGPGRRAGR